MDMNKQFEPPPSDHTPGTEGDASYLFCAEYEHANHIWGVEFYAASWADAVEKIESMKSSIRLHSKPVGKIAA